MAARQVLTLKIEVRVLAGEPFLSNPSWLDTTVSSRHFLTYNLDDYSELLGSIARAESRAST